MAIGILFVVLTAIVWVVLGAVVSHVAQKNLSLGFIQGTAAIVMVLLSVPFVLIHGESVPLVVLIPTFLSGVGNYVAFLVMNKAMQKGPNGLIWAIIQSAFAFPFLMGILFFQVPCSIVRGVGLVMLLAAMILMGLLGKGNEMNGKRNYIWVFYAVLGFLCAGATQCCANIPSYLIQEESDGVWTILSRIGISASGTVAVIVLHGLFDRKVFNGKGCKIGTIVMTAASILSLLFTFLALDCFAAVNAGAIAYPMIVGISIAVFMVYTAIKLKERLSLPVLLSVLLCLSGIVVITL